MSFWQTPGAQPKRNFRYKVQIDADVHYWAKAVTLPSFDISNTEIHHFDNRYYFPGRVTWNPVSFTLVDPGKVLDNSTKDVAAAISNMLTVFQYEVPASATAKSKTISRSASPVLNNVTIEVVDAAGTFVEKWELVNAWIESAKYGDLAYDNDELKTMEVVLRYDHAKHKIDGSTYVLS